MAQQAPAKPAAPNGKALHKSSPATTCSLYGKRTSLFSPSSPAPNRPPRVLHLPSPNPKQQRPPHPQATGVVPPPERRGTFPLRLCRRGMSEGGKNAASRLGTGRRDLGLEGPDHRDDEHAQREADDLKRPARLHVIKEGVAAGGQHDGISEAWRSGSRNRRKRTYRCPS